MTTWILQSVLWCACIYLEIAKCTDSEHQKYRFKKLEENSKFSLNDFSTGIEGMSAWTLSCGGGQTNESDVCHFRVQSYSFEGGRKIKEKTCPVPLNYRKVYVKGYNPGEEGTNRRWPIDSRHLSSGIFILHWRKIDDSSHPHRYAVHYSIIDMRDDDLNCEIHTIQLTRAPNLLLRDHIYYYLDNHNVFLDPNSMSVSIIYGFSKGLPLIQETFNVTGGSIGEPIVVGPFDVSDSAVMMIDNPFRDFNIDDRERFNVKLVCGYKYPCRSLLHDGNHYALSTSGNIYSSCERKQTEKWSCTTIGENSYKNFTIEFDYSPHHVMIYNVYGESFVAMTTQQLDDFDLSIKLTMFGIFGEKYQPVEFTKLSGGFMYHSMLGHFFYSKEDNDICFHLSWALGRSKERKLLIQCYEKTLLTKKLQKSK
ncbi:hypothetical protein QAD02_017943 [Eretmocerus hayati]|uniref:Uncharacterized protein n=1 Tax=Eretmocerus hayati TaxID=131215 RepID=A0ACC2PH56_9HYME|nr:hypothetical protein QAD02_017943 [Eretmocerus hayati]